MRNFTVELHLQGEDIYIDLARQAVRVVDVDGVGVPMGRVREGTIAQLIAEIETEQNRRRGKDGTHE